MFINRIKTNLRIILFAGSLLFAASVILLTLFILIPHVPDEYKNSPTKEQTVAVTKYGLPVDSFVVLTGIIRRNENLAEALALYNVPPNIIAKLSNTRKDIFDPRKVKAGNRYTLFCLKDKAQTVRYLVYEQSLEEYIFFDLSGKVEVKKVKRPVYTRRKYFSGRIRSSLWETMEEQHAHPQLAIELSEIYAWAIDFFMLMPGDHIYAIYEENYIEDRSIGIQRILAARFEHAGETYFAFPFMQDGVVSYFDEKGLCLRKQFLKAPLHFSRISSRFSGSRMHPILRIRRPHHGVDYAAPVGTPVHSIGDGIVISATFTKGAGYMVKVRHNNIYTSGYLHLSRFGKGIRKGVRVKQKQILGYVGSSGLSTGPHLDFRVWKNGIPVDPLKIKSPPALPVKPENQALYDSVKTYWMHRLKRFNIIPENIQLYD